MGEHARNLPPPLPEKRKPKLIEGAGEELEEISGAELIEVDDAGDPIVEIDVDLTELDEAAPDTARDAGMEQREKQRRERQPLFDALAARGLKTEAALEVIAAFDPELVKDKEFAAEMQTLASNYGVRFDAMSSADREKLMVMYLGVKNGRVDSSKAEVAEALEGGIREQLTGQAFADIEAMKAGLAGEVPTPEKLKTNLREVMATLHALSKQLPWGKKENAEVWQKIYNEFNGIRLSKKGSRNHGAEIEGAFRETFEEFSDFIEDEVVAYRIRHGGGSVEDVTREMYGRTKEEMEDIKRRNREAVVEAMGQMKEKSGVDIGMLEQLHALNNKGIVPKEFSKLREDPDAVSFFGKAGRLGLLGPDVKPYVQEMLDRANNLIDRDVTGDMSKIRYEIEAAKLHNDLLDMHPFGDRNGSTSLLFLELMMTRKGYEPSPERQKDYYKHLSSVVGYNPIAVAVVGYEQYKISNVPGYYEGLAVDDAKKAEYEKILGYVAKLKQRERDQKAEREKKK